MNLKKNNKKKKSQQLNDKKYFEYNYLSFYNVDKDLFAEAANTGDQNMNLSSQSIINAFCQSVSEKLVALHTQTHTHTFISTSHKYNQSDIQIFG